MLGPVDRVLGFGFGAVKGVMVVVVAFSLLVLGYDEGWGAKGRPVWIAEARTYQFVDAASRRVGRGDRRNAARRCWPKKPPPNCRIGRA